jgi:hypothetical protein
MSHNRTDDPIADFNASEARHEAQDARTVYSLRIEDVLASGPLNVAGLWLDCQATVWVSRKGQDGEVQIDTLDCKSLHVHLETALGPTDLEVAWTAPALSQFVALFRDAIRSKAIALALKTPNERWWASETEEM